MEDNENQNYLLGNILLIIFLNVPQKKVNQLK